MSHPLYGPRPGSGVDPEKTPTRPHERPAPVVVRSGTLPKQPPPLPTRTTTAPGGVLAPLGKAVPRPEGREPVPYPTVYQTDEDETTESGQKQAVLNRHLRTCLALPVEDLRLVHALALRLRTSAAGNDRG